MTPSWWSPGRHKVVIAGAPSADPRALVLKKFYALDTPRSHLVGSEDIALPPGEWGCHPRTSEPAVEVDRRPHRGNPGDWILHCHNTFHQEARMMTSLNYTT
jgi:Multicopper oxidase